MDKPYYRNEECELKYIKPPKDNETWTLFERHRGKRVIHIPNDVFTCVSNPEFVLKSAYEQLKKEIAAVEQLKADLRLSDLNRQSLWADSLKLVDENAALKSKLKIAVEAMRGLNNEVAAMVATHGDVISQDYGRTNLECLEYRLNIARKCLSEIGGEL